VVKVSGKAVNKCVFCTTAKMKQKNISKMNKSKLTTAGERLAVSSQKAMEETSSGVLQ